jgi:hypothetical protein
VTADIRRAPGASLIDVLDRVLDKGIVVDAEMRVSLAGIDLMSVEARMFVASFDTHLTHAAAFRSSRYVAASHNRVGQPSDRGPVRT